MLKDERLSEIINLINQYQTLKTDQIAEMLDISLATVRRDLNELDNAKKIKKVFGGAKAISKADYITTEEAMDTKLTTNTQEKAVIGQLAATLINEHDFVYLDAGSSIEALIKFITTSHVTFVTNSLRIAKELSTRHYKVLMLPGEIKLSTDAIVGTSASKYLCQFNFTKGFFGTNGVHKEIGFTTPDMNEAMVKAAAIERCQTAYVLADNSKFGKVSPITFCSDSDVLVITNQLNQEGIMSAVVKEWEGEL